MTASRTEQAISRESIFGPAGPSTASATREPDGTVELNELARQVAELFSANSISPLLIAGFVKMGDFAGLLASALVIYAFFLPVSLDGTIRYGSAGAAGALLAISLIQALDGYAAASLRRFFVQLSIAVAALTIAIMVLFSIGLFTDAAFSRFWLYSWYLSATLFFCVYRGALSLYIRRIVADGRVERRAVIVGGGEHAADLIRKLESQSQTDIRICGIFDDRDDERSPTIVAGYPKLGTIPELIEFGRRARIDMLIVSLPLSAESRVLQLLNKLWILPVDIRLSAHSNNLRFRPRTYSYEGTVPLFNVFDKPVAERDAVVKRAFDIVFASIALALLWPVLAAAAIAVRLESRGPALFRQKRLGYNNELLEVWKFRSMYVEMADANADRLVTRNDNRVTRVGRFIRKTSIDELPQLFNVLRGDLSLVGPRPHALNAKAADTLYHDAVEGYFARHRVKPGLTGWAQINGWRGETDTSEKLAQRVNHDLYYIENWSPLLDLYILAVTPFRLINTENSY